MKTCNKINGHAPQSGMVFYNHRNDFYMLIGATETGFFHLLHLNTKSLFALVYNGQTHWDAEAVAEFVRFMGWEFVARNADFDLAIFKTLPVCTQ